MEISLIMCSSWSIYFETMDLAFKNIENIVSFFAYFINDLISSIDENSYGLWRYSFKDGGYNIEFSIIEIDSLIPSTILVLPSLRSIFRNIGSLSIKIDSCKSPFLFWEYLLTVTSLIFFDCWFFCPVVLPSLHSSASGSIL